MVGKVPSPVGLGAGLAVRVVLCHEMLFEHVNCGLIKFGFLCRWATGQFPALACMGLPTGRALFLIGVVSLSLLLGRLPIALSSSRGSWLGTCLGASASPGW